MENFQWRQAGIDFPHQALHKDDITQADTEVGEQPGERHQVVEVVQLHGVAEVEGEESKVGAFVAEFFEHGDGDEVARQLEVTQALTGALVDEVQEILNIWHLKHET